MGELCGGARGSTVAQTAASPGSLIGYRARRRFQILVGAMAHVPIKKAVGVIVLVS